MKKLITIALMVLVTMWFTPLLPGHSAHGGKVNYEINYEKFKHKCKKTNYRNKYVNPEGLPGNVDVQGLAPRLDTIDGKIIYVHVCEAGPQTGPFLYEYLVANYPDTEWRHIQIPGFGPSRPEDEVLENADAVIGGQSW